MRRDKNTPLNSPVKPLLIVLSGLSGAGKDTVLEGLRQSSLPLYFSVSATTREPRPGEKEGYDYYFVTKDKFQEMIGSNQMLEWARVYGNFYGRPLAPVRQAIQAGKDVIVRIDVQGAVTIKKKYPQALLIFLSTMTLEELEERLKKRRTETKEQLELRLKTANEELDHLETFDYFVINREDEIKQTVDDVLSIITAEKCRVKPRTVKL